MIEEESLYEKNNIKNLILWWSCWLRLWI